MMFVVSRAVVDAHIEVSGPKWSTEVDIHLNPMTPEELYERPCDGVLNRETAQIIVT